MLGPDSDGAPLMSDSAVRLSDTCCLTVRESAVSAVRLSGTVRRCPGVAVRLSDQGSGTACSPRLSDDACSVPAELGARGATAPTREGATRRHRPMMVPQSQPPEAIVGRAGSSRDMWFHHPSQALPLTATVPRLPNGMERKAVRAYSCLLYTSPSPRDQRGSRMPSSA